MTAEQKIALGFEIGNALLPLLSKIASAVASAFGGLSADEAKALMRQVDEEVATTAVRIADAKQRFADRDAANDQRVTHL